MSQTIGGALLAAFVLLAAGRTGPGLLLLACAVALMLLVAKAKAVVGRPATRMVRIHTHGGHGTRLAATHEGGHYRQARKLGLPTGRVVIRPDGSGYTEVDLSKASAVDNIAVSIAGRIAAGTQSGCGGTFWPERGSDNWHIQQALKTLPAGERAAALRRGTAIARRDVGGVIFDGGVGAVRDKLLRDGHL